MQATDTNHKLKIEFKPTNPLIRVFSLSSRQTGGVPADCVAIVSDQGSAFDHLGEAEIYLPYSKIPARRVERDIVELAICPGSIEITAEEFLPGISLHNEGAAIADFTFDLRLVDPMMLLQKTPRRDNEQDNDALLQRITQAIEEKVSNIFYNQSIELWTSPDFNKVTRSILDGLNNLLSGWGIRIDLQTAAASRKYPERLVEVVLQFREVEGYLISASDEEKTRLIDYLDLPTDWLQRIRAMSVTEGSGSGLFRISRERRDVVDQFITWMDSPEQRAYMAADFLREVYSPDETEDFDRQPIALTEAILESTFKHPRLGFGQFDKE